MSMNPLRPYGTFTDSMGYYFLKFLVLNSNKMPGNVLAKFLDDFEVLKYVYFDEMFTIPTFPDLAV